MTAVSEVGLLRLVALGLAGPPVGGPAEVVRHLLALQGQALPGALQSVALRARTDLAAVRAALDDGSVVRSWPMRGTLHLVAAEDLPWMLDLLSARPLAAAARRRPALGLTDADLDRAGEVAAQVLAGTRLSRAALLAALADGGVDVSGQRGYHVLWYLAQTGLTVLGPTAEDGDQAFALLSEWVPSPRRLAREEALAELALRYATGHGPATAHDLARWADLPLRDVRAGLAAVRDRLLEVDGRFMAPDLPDRLAACREEAEGLHLLPGFDELVLGYADRDDVLDPEHADRICPGRNGVFRPTVVLGGRVIGTWGRAGLELFATQPEAVERAVRAALDPSG